MRKDELLLKEIIEEKRGSAYVVDIDELAFLSYCENEHGMKTSDFMIWFKEECNLNGSPEFKLWYKIAVTALTR